MDVQGGKERLLIRAARLLEVGLERYCTESGWLPRPESEVPSADRILDGARQLLDGEGEQDDPLTGVGVEPLMQLMLLLGFELTEQRTMGAFHKLADGASKVTDRLVFRDSDGELVIVHNRVLYPPAGAYSRDQEGFATEEETAFQNTMASLFDSE